MSKLSTLVQHAEFASKVRVLRAEIYTERDGEFGIVMRLADGRDWYMHSPDAVEIDWTPPTSAQAAHLRSVYDYHR